MSLKNKLKQQTLDTVRTEAASDPRIEKLRELNPRLKYVYIMNAWSGFVDGDPEHHVFYMALGREWWEDCLGYRVPENGDFRKFLDTEMEGGDLYYGMIPYSAEEKDEVARFREEEPDAYREYFDLQFQLAKDTLSPIKDMVPMDVWIKIPIGE